MAPPVGMANMASDSGSNMALALYVILVLIYRKKLTLVNYAASIGVGLLVYSLENPVSSAAGAACLTLLVMVYMFKKNEGFNTRTPAPDIAKQILSQKANFQFSSKIEGYEDVKKEKDEKPAPVKEEKGEKESSVENVAVPFKLGEIPSQIKNGPHLDAGSTLVKAINSLNPEQIQAMSKDTQQLIETQKSLMSMLSTMKPMLNDGKELMKTFDQMFN
jgi:hypothetical protein